MSDLITTQDLLRLVPLGDLIAFYHLSTILGSPSTITSSVEIEYAVVDYLAYPIYDTVRTGYTTGVREYPTEASVERLCRTKFSDITGWGESRIKDPVLKWFSAVSVPKSDPTVLDLCFGLIGGEPFNVEGAKRALNELRVKVKSTIEGSLSEINTHRQRVVDQIRLDGIPGSWAAESEKAGFILKFFPELPELSTLLNLRAQTGFLRSMTEAVSSKFPAGKFSHRGNIDEVSFAVLEHHIDPSLIQNIVASSILHEKEGLRIGGLSSQQASCLALASARAVVLHFEPNTEYDLIKTVCRSIARYAQFPLAISSLMTPKVAKLYYCMELESENEIAIEHGAFRIKGRVFKPHGGPFISHLPRFRFKGGDLFSSGQSGVKVLLEPDTLPNWGFFQDDTGYQYYNSASPLCDFVSRLKGEKGKVLYSTTEITGQQNLTKAEVSSKGQLMLELML